MHTAAKNVGNGDAGDTNGIHGVHKLFQFVLASDDDHLGELMRTLGALGRRNFSRSLGGGCGACGNLGDTGHRSRNRTDVVMNGETGITACDAVLDDIKTCDLFLCGNTKTDRVFQNLENDRHGNGNPGNNTDNAEDLDAKEMETAAGEKSLPFGTGSIREKTDGQSAEKTVEPMDTDCTDRIVYFQDFINKFNTENNDETGQDTNDGSRSRRNGIAACSDGYQTGQGAV